MGPGETLMWCGKAFRGFLPSAYMAMLELAQQLIAENKARHAR